MAFRNKSVALKGDLILVLKEQCCSGFSQSILGLKFKDLISA
jgi:hypothetical protein